MKYQTQVSLLKLLLSLKEKRRHQEMLGEVIRLPSQIYTSKNILSDEMHTVFKEYPMVAGHAAHVREPGTYLLSDWDKLPFIVVRGNDGKLRAFINSCRHRGARLVDGSSERLKRFVCPFHGWSYTLDGKLNAMTRHYNFPSIKKSDCHLRELPVIENNGLVWIHPRFDGQLNLQHYLGDIYEDIQYFELNRLVSYKKTKVTKNANWKLLLKTYLEGYHVPYLHRHTLQKSFKNGVIAHHQYGPNIRLVAARSNFEEMKQKPETEWNILNYASVYYSLFPNTFFIMHPDYVSINMFFPLSPDRTIWTHDMLYDPEKFTGSKGQEALAKRFEFTNYAVFDKEDFAIAESVQSNIEFKKDDHIIGLEEGLIGIFQRSVDEAISNKKNKPRQ